jgi:hypothetical protein
MTTETTTALTLPETMKLGQLEMIVDRGLTNFVAVGNALFEIRDLKLYREKHATFEAYCRGKWGMSRVQAHRLIEAAAVVEMLPNGNKVSNEAQARELAKVPTEDRPAVLEQAAAEGPVTAKTIRKAAGEAAWAADPEPEPAVEPQEPQEPDTLRALKVGWEESCESTWSHASKAVKREFLGWIKAK